VASDLSLGDVETPFIVVSPADADTQVTLEVRPPNADPYPLVMAGGDLEPIANSSPQQYSQRWEAVSPVTYDAASKWVLHFDVTGTGEGDEDLEIYVVPSPVAGGPAWWPGRSRVAAYVPHRTLVRSVASTINSQDGYAMTFDSTTVPDGLTVSRLIADGGAWVGALISPLHAKSEGLASLLVALWAAIAVERGYPDDDQSLQRANDMEKQLNTMLGQLTEANNAANGTDSYGLDLAYPVYSFPPADLRYDYSTYW